MPKLSTEFKEAIAKLGEKELRKLVLNIASKDQAIYDLIYFNYVTGQEELEDLLEETKDKIIMEMDLFSTRGIYERNLAKAIGKAVKHINYFSKLTKNKVMEAELLLFLLEEVFENHSDALGTCWTVFDSKVAITTNRLFNLVTKKLNEDYLIEYQKPLNRFLNILHTTSNHLDYVYDMPKAI